MVLYTPAIFDSGTSYIVAPPAQADAFWAAVPGAAYVPGSGQYTFPCGQKVGMVVKFVGQDQGFSVNELDINVRSSPWRRPFVEEPRGTYSTSTR